METTEKKVDLKAIMAKAKKTVSKVVKSTEKVNEKIDTYQLVPGFSKYEFNGVILRNVKTKNIISFKTGRTKYQLTNDKEESKNLSKDEIKALMPVDCKPKKVVIKKEKAAKKQKVTISNEEIEKLTTDPKVKEVLALSVPKHEIHYRLHLLKLDTKTIMQLTDTPYPATKRNIWYYTSKQKTL